MGVYGPSGEAGGSECFLKSNISGPGNPYQYTGELPFEINSAKLTSDPGQVFPISASPVDDLASV